MNKVIAAALLAVAATPAAAQNITAPPPPMQTAASICAAFKLSMAFLRNSAFMNSRHRPVFKIVPPRWIILAISRVCRGRKTLFTIPE
jgi:hypothetical protein